MTPEKAKNIYWGAMPLPSGAKSLGEYASIGKRGCLIKLANGNRVVGNAGAIRSIKGGVRRQPQDTPINPDRREILTEVGAGAGIMALVGLLAYWFFNTWASKVVII